MASRITSSEVMVGEGFDEPQIGPGQFAGMLKARRRHSRQR